MKFNTQTRNNIVSIICYIYVLLLTYAATSKFLDFENFQAQLGQSPLLSAFAGYIAWFVPITELLISIMLIIPSLKKIGLYAAYVLMVMFTTYIYIILNYSSFIPCSCGGILEELSWNQHIIFNIAFILLAIIGILFVNSEPLFPFSRNTIKKFVLLGIEGLFGIGLIVILFIWSENIIQYHNNFVRRFPHFPAVLDKEIDLKFDSYYFAGAAEGKIYLANYTAPLQMLIVDSSLKTKKEQKIKLDRMELPFTAIQTEIHPPYFYLVDGNVPCIFKGKMSNWKARYLMRGVSYFSHIEPIDSNLLAFRSTLKKTKTNTLGLLNLKDTTNIKFATHLIQKQIDGVFDTEGLIHYDKKFKRLVYVYTHRNQFIVTDSQLKLKYRGNTIDTTAHAQLKVVTISNTGETKLAAPPLIVNKTSALSKNLLFVNSGLPGKYESLIMWKKASIVDLYNIDNNFYLFSFYIYNSDNKKMRSLYIDDNHLYALIGNKLVSYKLRRTITEKYR
ncbi:MAG: hypothetical protein CVU08_12235 [Bacteroidetes bacterium HGW-Bacteroidetes-3]|jgi:uncharacterized membrane protein YphA (DoxX/SURF4 family)|nr:MAG: hypothetical protein CVU08_12235 [Bacteroidetes bacterium HGW-Bacteroidetes-3]